VEELLLVEVEEALLPKRVLAVVLVSHSKPTLVEQ